MFGMVVGDTAPCASLYLYGGRAVREAAGEALDGGLRICGARRQHQEIIRHAGAAVQVDSRVADTWGEMELF